jgi:hypothetical protein
LSAKPHDTLHRVSNPSISLTIGQGLYQKEKRLHGVQESKAIFCLAEKDEMRNFETYLSRDQWQKRKPFMYAVTVDRNHPNGWANVLRVANGIPM